MFDYKSIVFLLVLGVLDTRAAPAQDVQIVESTIREVRAAAPDDLLVAETSYGHDYGADDEDSVGYLKRTADGGSDGYQHFDSYHKKDGDKYGYEKHTSFGKANNAEYDADDKAEGDEKAGYKVSEELNEGEGENEEYEDEGNSEKYTEGGEANNSGENYTEGGDDGAAAHYTGEGEHFEYDDGDSAKYTEAVADDESGAEEADDY